MNLHWEGEDLKRMGLPVNFRLPKEVYLLMELYPQAPSRRPTVQYIPMPYQYERDK